MAARKINLYLVSVVLFMLVLPLVSVMVEMQRTTNPPIITLSGKWLIFWAVGVRLFVAGMRQATKPAFTAQKIFRMSGTDSFPVIRELGFANLSIGLIAILSICWQAWRMPAAVAGGLYFGLASLLHIIKKPDSGNELIALISDLYIFSLMTLYLLFN